MVRIPDSSPTLRHFRKAPAGDIACLDLVRKRPPTEAALRNQEMGISRAERRNERRPRVVAVFGEAIADSPTSRHSCHLSACRKRAIRGHPRFIQINAAMINWLLTQRSQAQTMPRYSPIEIPVPLAASGSDLVAFRWETRGVAADFLLPDKRAIRVTFNKPCIVRILDEMPLSTENDGPSEDLVPDHFAYQVEGSAFVDAQSEAWKLVNAPVTHYRFITGWACMDVLSSGLPSFTVVERSSARSA